MNKELALKNLRSLLNLKNDEMPVFNLTKNNNDNYKASVENINVVLDENEPNSVEYLWNNLIMPLPYEIDDEFTDASKGFLQSYITKRSEWIENSILFHQEDLSLNVLKNINKPIEGEKVILKPAVSGQESLYYKHLIEDGDFFYYTMIPLEKGNPKLLSYNLLHPYSFAIEDKITKNDIGVIGLRPLRKDALLNDKLGAAVLSYYIYKEYRGNGFAKEAVKLIVDAYFNEELYGLTITDYKWEMEVERVEAISISLDCSEFNTPSIKLALGNGFIKEAVLHNTWYSEGTYSNGVHFFLDKETYFKDK